MRKIVLASLVACTFVFLCFFTAQMVIAQPPLCPEFEDLTQDIGRGFGSVVNKYGWSTAEFNNNIYVGTLNVGIWGGGGEVWKHTTATGTWTRIINNGGTSTGNRGFRNMVVYNDNLYTGSGVTNTPQLYEIDASDNWQVVATLPGSSIRGMAVHNDGTGNNCLGDSHVTGEKLYIGTENPGGGEIYCYDGSNIVQVTQLPTPKYMVSALISYQGNLYAGTWAEDEDVTTIGDGFGLYLIQTSGSGGYTDKTPNIETVYLDSGVMVLIEYDGYLYLGTMNWTENSPFSLIHSNNPTDQDSWVEDTTDGFGYPNSRYAWTAMEFNNNLYVGVFNPDSLGQLWATDEVGGVWEKCVDGISSPLSGFDGRYNWGLRSMAVQGQGGRLFISTASELFNYFGGGCQVWASLTPAGCTDTDGDGYSIEGGGCGPVDCHPDNPAIYPTATEVCDGVDNDCDVQVDEGATSTYYMDADGDTYGDLDNSIDACPQPAGYVTDNTDCDDGVADINPGATEVCNDGIDNDCDGDTDSADSDCGKSGCGAAPMYRDGVFTSSISAGKAFIPLLVALLALFFWAVVKRTKEG